LQEVIFNVKASDKKDNSGVPIIEELMKADGVFPTAHFKKAEENLVIESTAKPINTHSLPPKN